MIVVTGGAGFIGSAVVARLNEMGYEQIIIVDRLGTGEKWKNLNGLKFIDIHHKDDFYKMLIDDTVPFAMETVIHLGACSATTEKDADYLTQNNFRYSCELVKHCLPRRAHFIYASSAATYGDGSKGYDDKTDITDLRPLNMYGYSKQIFDVWAQQMEIHNKIVGLKFFNVFGPNEYHKENMRSLVHKAYEQVLETGKIKLFKSDHPDYGDGDQKRDFIYVKDAVDMIVHFVEHQDKGGLFNVGSGKARSWNDLAKAIFTAMGEREKIEYIDMPSELKGKYQYFTEATMDKMKEAGYEKETYSLEEGVKDYIQNYLTDQKYLGF